VKSRLIARLPETPGRGRALASARGEFNTAGKSVSKLTQGWAGGWGPLLPLLPGWLSGLTLSPVIAVQHRATRQPGPGPGMQTRAEAAVICVHSSSTAHPDIHKRCRTSHGVHRCRSPFSCSAGLPLPNRAPFSRNLADNSVCAFQKWLPWASRMAKHH